MVTSTHGQNGRDEKPRKVIRIQSSSVVYTLIANELSVIKSDAKKIRLEQEGVPKYTAAELLRCLGQEIPKNGNRSTRYKFPFAWQVHAKTWDERSRFIARFFRNKNGRIYDRKLKKIRSEKRYKTIIRAFDCVLQMTS